MSAKEYVNTLIPVLKPSDTVAKALILLEESKQDILPFATVDTFLGYLSEEILLNFSDETSLSEIQPLPFSIIFSEDDPLLELIKKVVLSEYEWIPLLSANDKFIGVIGKFELFEVFILKLNLQKGSGNIEILVKDQDYSISDISRIIEMESAKIINMFSSEHDDNQFIISFQLETSNMSGVISALDRYGFSVLSYFSTEPVNSIEKDRFDHLMKYLSV